MVLNNLVEEPQQISSRYDDLIKAINRANYKFFDVENPELLHHLTMIENRLPHDYFLPPHFIVRLIRIDLKNLISKTHKMRLSEEKKALMQILSDDLPNCSTVEQFNHIIEQITTIITK